MSFKWLEEINRQENNQNEILSFNEYMDFFEKHPSQECRPSYEYLLDMLDYFGKSKRGHYKLFQTVHPDSPPVFGQFRPQKALYENLKTFQEEGVNNKFILLVGPNGSSKTSLVNKFMKGAEVYSETPEGALYTFSWVFPLENFIKGSLGLGPKQTQEHLQSYAHLDDKDITTIITSELKDPPILLIPPKYRKELIEQGLKAYPDKLESIKKSYLYNGDLSKRNKMIYDALLKNYKGNHQEVLKHIRVERFRVSKRYSVGAVTIEPQIHIDARIQQITMDKRLVNLPPSLQSLNLFSLQGETILANRGILEFSDLLKRPMDAFKYLLMTTETASLNLQGILTALDIFFIGTSNEIHFAAFKQHPDFNSFKGRFNFVKVPYLLDYKNEAKIYREQVHGLKNMAIFEPHSVTILSLFAIMTRLRSCQSTNYQDKKLSQIAQGLNPLEKALAYCVEEKNIPERLDSELKTILKHNLDQIKVEFENDGLYEGKFGISPRDIKKIIYELAENNKIITFIEVIEYLEKLITKKSSFDFLNMSPQGDFHNPARFITLLKNYGLDIFDKELRNSLGLIDNRSYENYIKRYIENINALIKGEKIKNEITGKFEDCDEFFIKEFEASINLKEDANNFRSHLISKLGAYYLDNPGIRITYKDVFPDLMKRLQESFRDEQKKMIQNISKYLVFYESELGKDGKLKNINSPQLSEKNRQTITKTLENLQKEYHYTQNAAISLLKYIIKERY